jgi:hypothetical protein
MILEVVNKSFCNRSGETKFKLQHMVYVLRHQHKWCTRHGDSDDASKRSCLNVESNYSSASPDSVELSRPISYNSAKVQHKDKSKQ